MHNIFNGLSLDGIWMSLNYRSYSFLFSLTVLKNDGKSFGEEEPLRPYMFYCMMVSKERRDFQLMKITLVFSCFSPVRF